MTEREVWDFFMTYDRFGEYVISINDHDELAKEDVRLVMDSVNLDVKIRAAKSAGEDTANLEAKRAALLQTLTRNAACYLCETYQDDDNELEERQQYLKQLEILDRKSIRWFRLWLFPEDEETIRVEVNFYNDGHVSSVRFNSKKADMDEGQLQHVEKLVRACNTVSWRDAYGNIFSAESYHGGFTEEWKVATCIRLDQDASAAGKCRIHETNGYGKDYPPEWHHLMSLVRFLYKHTDNLMQLPEIEGIKGKEAIDISESEKLVFHKAFTCSMPYPSRMQTRGEYTAVPLKVPYAARCRNPSLCPWDNPNCLSCGEFSNEKIGFTTDLDPHATGFAIMRGRTLVFIYLGGSYEDASRLLKEMPQIETGFTPGIPTEREAMQKIAMVLTGAALFNWQVKDVPYAYTGHQEGIWSEGQAYLTKDEQLNYFWTGCNSDVFMPRFSQVGT